MAAPQPNPPGKERDTFFLKNASVPVDASPRDAGSDDGNLMGHFDVGQIPPGDEGRIEAGGLKGVFLKWLIDEKFGARHHRLLFIEYLPGVSIGLHDHTYEEAYFILSGEVEATMDGDKYRASAGDVLWTGVGCVHAFANTGSEPVRWLETFSPQPPQENVFRFVAEWNSGAGKSRGPDRAPLRLLPAVAPVQTHPIDIHRQEFFVLEEILVLRQLHFVWRAVRTFSLQIRHSYCFLEIREVGLERAYVVLRSPALGCAREHGRRSTLSNSSASARSIPSNHSSMYESNTLRR
jgi:quercetin dioxygenase-like cupin family protein